MTAAFRRHSLRCLLFLLLILSACRNSAPPPAGPTLSGAANILVDADGLYRLTSSELSAAGFTSDSLTSDNLTLRTGDTAVPFLIADDSLIFYGIAPDNRYTATRTYRLESGPNGLVMAETAVPQPTTTPQTRAILHHHQEENTLYEPRALADLTGDSHNFDLWFWDTIAHDQQITLNVDLPAVADGSGELTLALWGFTYNPNVDPDHDLTVVVNGRSLDTLQWDGETHHTATLTMPPGTLINGRNTILLDNSPPSASLPDIMRLNWLAIDYLAPTIAANDRLTLSTPGPIQLSGFSSPPRLFDISNPWQPVHLTGIDSATIGIEAPSALVAAGPRGYRTPTVTAVRQSNWRDNTHQADLLILTTDALAPALAPLVTARQEQGLTVAIAPIAEIYDTFGDGSPTPDTIRDFLRYAATNWQIPPRYLLIVGDATIDYRNYLGKAPANTIPAPMVTVQFGGETVSDARLVDFNDDLHPDIAVGRWPVQTAAEVTSLVERTLAYERGTAVSTTLFTADASEARFASLATQLAADANLPADQITQLNGPTPAELTTAWNNGAWLSTYVGHGSVQQWGKENLLTPETAESLAGTTPPIVLQLTCLTGLFADPNVPSLSESMLTQPAGPVLLIAATSLTLSNHQEPFAIALLQHLQDPAYERIGDAFHDAKLSLDITTAGLREISDTYTLIGDPSAMINRPSGG